MSSPLDFMYELPTWPMIVGILLLMMGANELGYQFARRTPQKEPESSRSVSWGLKTSIFGLVALLLGFSFSMTSGRHDNRRKMILDEANAIGTCYLRAGLLADLEKNRIRELLHRYVTVRLEYFDTVLNSVDRQRTTQEMDALLDALWKTVEEANRKNPSTMIPSQIVPAANQVINLAATRAWVARDHIPAPVLIMLVICLLVTSLLIGHSSGQAGKRHFGLWAAFNVLLCLILFVILDFDRPRRGFIQVDHTSLIELKASLDRNSIP